MPRPPLSGVCQHFQTTSPLKLLSPLKRYSYLFNTVQIEKIAKLHSFDPKVHESLSEC